MAIKAENVCGNSGDRVGKSGGDNGTLSRDRFGMVVCPGCGRRVRLMMFGATSVIPKHSKHEGRKYQKLKLLVPTVYGGGREGGTDGEVRG